ncbi:hypothetical protein Tco_0167375 [Tanacetum coccineum]
MILSLPSSPPPLVGLGGFRRQRSLIQWVLKRKTTASDPEAADFVSFGIVVAAEFVIYKLKEMGKISQDDITPIMDEFETHMERVFVWKIIDGADEDDKPQITGKIVIALEIEVDCQSVHPQFSILKDVIAHVGPGVLEETRVKPSGNDHGKVG